MKLVCHRDSTERRSARLLEKLFVNGNTVDPYDALIIGGGPAGASCATWLKQLGFEPCIVERRPQLGGLQNDSPYLNQWIATAVGRTGMEIASDIATHVVNQRIDCLLQTEVKHISRVELGFEIHCDGAPPLAARTVVLACGVRAVDDGFVAGPDVIVGPGRAVADADFRDKRVAILGGGDNAFENFQFIRNRGAREVHLYARTIRARPGLRKSVPMDAVTVGAYCVDDEKITVNGRAFDCLVVLYGWAPASACAHGLAVECDSQGFVRTNNHGETSVPGVYAAGEITRRSHPCCTTAMAEGVMAAKAIQSRLERLFA